MINELGSPSVTKIGNFKSADTKQAQKPTEISVFLNEIMKPVISFSIYGLLRFSERDNEACHQLFHLWSVKIFFLSFYIFVCKSMLVKTIELLHQTLVIVNLILLNQRTRDCIDVVSR